MGYISTVLADYKVPCLITVHISLQASPGQRSYWVIRRKRWPVAFHESPHLGCNCLNEGWGDVIMGRDTGVDCSDRWACWDKREQLGYKGPISWEWDMRPVWTPWVAHSVIATEKTGEQLIIWFENWAKCLLCKVIFDIIIKVREVFGVIPLFDQTDPPKFPSSHNIGSRDAIFIEMNRSNNCAT